MVKVLYVGQLIGGLDIYIRNNVAYLDRDVEVVLVHGNADNNEPIFRDGHEVKSYSISMSREQNLLKDLCGLVQLLRIVKSEKPDIIHCHSARAGVLGRIAGYVWGVKTFYTPHAFSFLSTASKLRGKVYLSIERMVKLKSSLIACSESEGELGREFVKYKKERIYVWNNAVPDESLSGENDNIERCICYVGRPSYQKNTSFFVDVVSEVHKKHPDVHFKLLGIGYYCPNVEQLKEQIKTAGLSEIIELYPWLSHDEMIVHIKKSLFYLTVARYEGLPLAVIEAMSLSKAVVASNVYGNRDCVIDGYNGALLQLDVKIFADKIDELLQNSELLAEFSKNSRKLFLDKFLIDKRIKGLKDIYHQGCLDK